MEKVYPFKIPEFITWFTLGQVSRLKTDYQLKDYFFKQPELYLNVEKFFGENIRGSESFDRILSAYGPIGVRNRIAEYYLNHLEFGEFPRNVEIDSVEDVLSLETRLKGFSFENDGHIFLISYFLKFQFLYYQNLGLEELSLYPLATEVDEILQMGTGRCVRSDWLVFYIALFSQYYDVDEIKGFISKKLWSPSQLFQRLGVNNRKDAFSKCMQYAFAINDMDFLLYNKV